MMNKRAALKFILVIGLLFVFFGLPKEAKAQTTGDYQTFQTGDWSNVNSWSRWNGSSWVNPAPSAPTSTDGVITILNGHTITVTSAASVDQVIINAGGQVTVNNGITLTIANGTGDDLTVNGTLSVAGTLTMTANAGAIVIGNTGSVSVSGTLTLTGSTNAITVSVSGALSTSGTNTSSQNFTYFTINSGGTFSVGSGTTFTLTGGSGSTIAKLTVASGGSVSVFGTLNDTNGNTTVNGGGALTVESGGVLNVNNTLATLQVDANGNFNISGSSTWSLGTFTLNGTMTINNGGTFTGSKSSVSLTIPSGATANVSGTLTLTGGNPTLTVSAGGNLNITGGSVSLASISYFYVYGAVAMSGASTLSVTRGNGGNVVYLYSGGNITMSDTASIGIGGNGNAAMEVYSGGNLIMGPSAVVNGGGDFSLDNGASMSIGSTAGISAPGTNTGNIQVTGGTRSYGTGANYTYNGTATQNSGSGLPATVNNLTISNTAGDVTLGASVAISATLQIDSGAVLAPIAGAVINGAGGTLTGNGTAKVTKTTATADFSSQYTIANKTLTNLTVSYVGTAAQIVSALTYGNLTINNSSGVTFGGSVDVGGTLTLTSGTFPVAGNTLTLNGPTIAGTPANLSTTSSSNLVFGGSSSGVNIPSSVTALNNLTINNSNGVTLNSSPTISGTLTLTSGTFPVAGNTLTLNGPTIAGTPANLSTTSSSNLVFGGSSSGVNIPSSVTALNNLTINNSNGVTLNSSPTISGTLTLTSGTFPVAGNTLTLNGPTIAGTPANLSTTSSSNLVFGGSSGGVNIPSSVTALNNLTINNSNGVTLNSSLTISGTLTLTSGTFPVAGNTLTLNGPTIAGTPANLSTTSSSSLVFGGSSGGVDIPSSVTALNNLTINNANGVTLNSSPTISGTLTLTSGKVTTGSNTVTIGSSGSVSRTSGYVIGNLQKNVATGATSRTFEVGTASNYNPVTVAFGNVGVAGDLTAKATAGEHPNIASSTIDSSKDVNAYWTLTNTGISFDNYSATFTFTSGDVDGGANTSNFAVGKYNGGWTYPTVGTKTSTSTQATGLTSFSDFAVGESSDTTPPTVSTLSPLDDATGVAIASDLVMTFNEAMAKGTGNILIKKTSDESTVQTIDVTSGQVTIVGATVTINPADLENNTGYYVEMASGVLTDQATPTPNAYAGISGKTVWNFSTLAAAPTVVGATTNAAGTIITITFSKAMANPAGKHGEFKYKIGGGADQSFSAAALNADTTKIDLTTSGTAIAYGDVVTVSYTKGTVVAADTGVLESFSGQAVTNAMSVPAPTAVSATTNTAGTVITITFSKAMANPAGKQAEFKYKIGGGSDQPFSAAALNADTTKIDLTTSGTAIAYGDVVTVSYTKGTVVAADTGVLESFSGQAVTNVMPILAPTVVSATTNTAGTVITITFSKAMANPAGKHGEFAYKIGGGADQSFSAAALNADTTKIDLTTSGTAIAYGDVVTVGYTAGTVTAADTGVLATFASQAVTNAMLASAPTVVSATTNTAGTVITITFSKAMANPAGKHGEFSYKIGAGTDQTFSAAALEGDPTKIDLTTSGTAIAFGDTVTVSYTKGTVVAVDTGVLESFSGQAVTNAMLASAPTVVSATTNTAGTVITITFSKAMANPAGKHGEFAYKIGAGANQTFSAAALNADPTKIDLTTSGTAIAFGDVVTVGYTAGTVTAADTGVLATFASQAVTNAMLASAPTVVSAATNPAGTIITITFSKAMANPAGKHGEFAYKIGGGADQAFSAAALNADPTKIDLTTSGTAIAYGDTVTVAYTKGTVVAADTGVLESFAGQAVTNNIADFTAPVLATATVENAAPSDLVLTYNEPLDTGSVPANTAFTIGGADAGGRTVTGVAVAANKVTLTLSAALVAGNVITVSYTVPGTNPIQDGAGNDAAALVNQAVVNNVLDFTAPVLATATVENAAPSDLVLTYNEPLDTGSVPANTAFTIGGADAGGRTVTGVAVATNKVTLTLSAALVAGNVITVSYAVPGTNPIQDGAGNDAAALVNQAVVNNVASSAPTFSTAATNTAGTVITITFSKAMADPAGKHGEFAYKIGGGADQTFSAAALDADPTKIDLTTSGTPIAYGDTVTVSYTKGTVVAADAGVLESFSGQAVVNNVAPPAPTFSSAATSADGTKIIITFSKAMADPAGKHGEFSYQIGDGALQSFSAAALNADTTKIDLTTSGTAIAYGDVVTVSYTAGTVVAADGGVLETFTGQSVTNAMPVPAPTVVSAATNTSGTVITITFSKAMANPAGKHGEFSYQIGGGALQPFSAAALNADTTKINLTTSGTAIAHGDVVTVGYTAGTVTAADTGVLASFTGQSVTNNVENIVIPSPTVVSAATNPAGTIITIAFNKAMANPAGKHGEFTYKIGAGSDQPFSAAALNADTTKIDLTVGGTAIAFGDVVTVGYTAGTVTAADGGALATFTGQAVTNTMPGPPPTVVSAATNTSGTVITITFNKAMADPAGKHGEFAYKLGAGSDQPFSAAALNADPTKIDLTVAGTAITYLDTVTVGYTVGTVTAADGGALATFTGQAVTNNTQDNPPMIKIISPAAGSMVFGPTTILARGSDDDRIVKVEFFIDDVKLGETTQSGVSAVESQGAKATAPTASAAESISAFIDGNHLRKLDRQGLSSRVLEGDPEAEFVQSVPGGLIVQFRTAQSCADGYPHILALVDTSNGVRTGLDMGSGSLEHNFKFSPAVQADGEGQLYGIVRNGTLVSLRKLGKGGPEQEIYSDAAAIEEWLVRRNGTVLLAGKSLSSGERWLRSISPSGEVRELTFQPVKTDWFVEMADGTVLASLADKTQSVYAGVYEIPADLGVLGEDEARNPLIGRADNRYVPRFAPGDGTGPSWEPGLEWTALGSSAGNDAAGAVRGPDGTDLILELYPVARQIRVPNLDRVDRLKITNGVLCLAGGSGIGNRFVVYDLVTGAASVVDLGGTRIGDFVVLDDGTIQAVAYSPEKRAYVAGLIERMGTGISWRETAVLNAEPRGLSLCRTAKAAEAAAGSAASPELASLPSAVQEPGLNPVPGAKNGGVEEDYTINWDTMLRPNGTCRIKVVATDSSGQTGSDEITVTVANIRLTLEATRIEVRAWAILRYMGSLAMTWENPAHAQVSKFVILKKVENGDFQVLAEIPATMPAGSGFTYQDKWLAKSAAYTYRIEALNAAGNVIGRSSDKTI